MVTSSINIDANYDIHDSLMEGTCDLYFDYDRKSCGIEVEVMAGVNKYTAWCGDEVREYNDPFDVVSDKFYSGKSIDDLITVVQFRVA